ncbi:het-domain-containing protein [Apiospora phragmitis]|uniref:Het-domain-containing protein n=1 Tax=Apiospora phragmitis TaxID=2905665 RepID=A0ABR1W9J9_9PEZI
MLLAIHRHLGTDHDEYRRRLEFLTLMRALKETIPHDKIYGMYPILQEMGFHLPDPAYSKPIAEVIQDFARACIRELGSLDVFTWELPIAEIPGKPSWVLNCLSPEPSIHATGSELDRPGQLRAFRVERGGEGPNAAYSSRPYQSPKSPSEMLLVQGKKAGTVQTTLACASELIASTTDIRNFHEYIRVCREWFQICSARDKGPETFLSSFGKSTALRLGFDGLDTWLDLMRYPECRDFSAELFERHTTTSVTGKADPASIVTDYLSYKGESDVARKWASSRAPVILRPDGDTFRYVTPAYMPAMMEGECWPKNEDELKIITLS